MPVPFTTPLPDPGNLQWDFMPARSSAGQLCWRWHVTTRTGVEIMIGGRDFNSLGQCIEHAKEYGYHDPFRPSS